MTRILAFEGGSSTPFRVIGPGGDPDNPSLSDVVFNANHASMRVVQKGAALSSSGGYWYNPGSSAPIALSRVVAGRRPLFLVCSLSDGSFNNNGYYELPYRGSGYSTSTGRPPYGIGLVADETTFRVLNFQETGYVSSGGIGYIIDRPRTMQYAIMGNTV